MNVSLRLSVTRTKAKNSVRKFQETLYCHSHGIMADSQLYIIYAYMHLHIIYIYIYILYNKIIHIYIICTLYVFIMWILQNNLSKIHFLKSVIWVLTFFKKFPQRFMYIYICHLIIYLSAIIMLPVDLFFFL